MHSFENSLKFRCRIYKVSSMSKEPLKKKKKVCMFIPGMFKWGLFSWSTKMLFRSCLYSSFDIVKILKPGVLVRVFPEFGAFLVWGNIWLLVRLQTLFSFWGSGPARAFFCAGLEKNLYTPLQTKLFLTVVNILAVDRTGMWCWGKWTSSLLGWTRNWIKFPFFKKWILLICAAEDGDKLMGFGRALGRRVVLISLGLGTAGSQYFVGLFGCPGTCNRLENV